METWRDIVAEMMELSKKDPLMWSPQEYLYTYSQRFKFACKALEEKIEANQELLKRALEYSDKQDEEIAKLRRALEPVMKCEVYRKVFHVNGGHALEPNFDWMIDAIREAQAIMKEGAE